MGVSGGAEVSAAGCDGEDAAASGCAGEDAAAEGEVVASAGCAGTADAQAVSRRAAVRMSGSVRFMCGSLLFGWCRDERDYHPVGAGHARPAGLRGRMFAGVYPGDGRWRKVSGASGTPPPTACPGMGGSGRSRRGEGTPPYGWGYGNARGVYADTRFRAAAR